MSKRKPEQKVELEGDEDSFGKRRAPGNGTGKHTKQSGCDSGKQTDDNNDQVGFEDKKSEIKNEIVSKDEELEEV